MKNTKTRRSVEKFNALDLYDDQLKSIRVERLDQDRNLAVLRLELIDYDTGGTKWLTFLGCANIRQNVDFDVVASNAFALMEKASASVDAKKMAKFVRGHKRHWRTLYMPPSPKDLPIIEKLASLHSFILFKVAFHGGTIEVLAKRFTLRNEK